MSGFDCELCGDALAEHFQETPWGERHICTPCAEFLEGLEDPEPDDLS